LDTHQQKISHLKALYHLACADNVYSRAEAIFIRNVANRLGVDEKELENFDGSEPELELPDREYKIYALFHRLAIIIMIDNEVREQEKQYCFNLGIKMGLHPNAITEVLTLVEDGDVGTAPHEVMDIFRKYLS
jgi:DnaJ-domain-containing protein 1